MPVPFIAQTPVDDFGQRFSDIIYSATLAASTDTTLTVPGNAQRYKAVIKITGSSGVFVALNTAASAPAGASFASTNSDITKQGLVYCREVKAGDILHFFTTGTNHNVTVSFYALGTTAGI